jgi:anti-sigma regulatory factor (Ser/Thr protein kinase)
MTRFERSVAVLPEPISALTEAVVEFLGQHGVDERASHHVGLVLDEILTNLATHGKSGATNAHVAVVVGADRVTGEIIDSGPEFDPRETPDPAIDRPAADRPVGGLGLYLVRKLTCALEYVRKDGENHMRFAVARGGQ